MLWAVGIVVAEGKGGTMKSVAETDRIDRMWDALQQHLEARRRPIQEEIRRYPPPIPACDAHFNYLLEQRALLSRELQRLEAARREGDAGAAVEAFVRASPCIEGDEVCGLFLADAQRG